MSIPVQINYSLNPDESFCIKNNIYTTLNEWNTWATLQQESVEKPLSYRIAEAIPFFKGEIINPETKEPFPQIMNTDELDSYISTHYEDKYMAKPIQKNRLAKFSEDREAANQIAKASATEIVKRATAFCKANYYKYAGLLQTLYFDYDPIENYRMIEEGNDKTNYSGKEYNDHDTKANQLGGLEINGPLSSATLGTNQDGTPSISLSFDMNNKIVSSSNQVSDTRLGEMGSQVTNNSVTTTAGSPVQTDHYTTTYDDSSRARLESYDTDNGTTANTSMGIGEVSNPVTGKAYSGAPNSPSYKDSKSFEDRLDETSHKLTRSGNIGVTTSQQMIESERELRRFNLVKEFCEELFKEISLSVWQ